MLVCLTSAAHATLAAIVPARDGLAVAADSRLSFMGASCEGGAKILIPPRPARTVVVVTGDSFFVAPPPAGTHDACRYLAGAPSLLDIGSIVLKALQGQSGNDSAGVNFAAVLLACTEGLEEFQKRYPGALRAYAGRAVFSVVVASYDPVRHAATLRNFSAGVDARGGRVEARRVSQTVLTPKSPGGIWIYGEAGWLNRAVYGGPGRRFLSAATLQLLSDRRPIATTSRAQALEAAENVVRAAIRTAKMVPPPSGVGGAIRAVYLGENTHPRPLTR